jgi:hypothetical protein
MWLLVTSAEKVDVGLNFEITHLIRRTKSSINKKVEPISLQINMINKQARINLKNVFHSGGGKKEAKPENMIVIAVNK